MNRFLSLAALVASLVLVSGEVSAQRLSVNPYQGLGFATSAPPDLCKVGTSGVDADARDTARNITQSSGTLPELEMNNCHLHPVNETFSVTSSTATMCHPDHEPPYGNCGRPAAEWCPNSAACTAGTCGQSDCKSPVCPVILTTHEVLAPAWSYDFPLDSTNSHELDIVATRQEKRLQGNCRCDTYSTAACPPPSGCVNVGGGVEGFPGGSTGCSPGSNGDNDGPDGLDDPGQDLDRDGVNSSDDVNDMDPDVGHFMDSTW